jgi:hypothetical protein
MREAAEEVISQHIKPSYKVLEVGGRRGTFRFAIVSSIQRRM